MNYVITNEYLEEYRENINYYKWLVKRAKVQNNHSRKEKYKSIILRKQKCIREAISYIKQEHYKQILIMRYIYGFKWVKIIELFFNSEPDFNMQKDYKFKDKIFYWHRRALIELRKANKEEKTAINTLKKIKKICNKYIGIKPQDKEFMTNILTLIDSAT